MNKVEVLENGNVKITIPMSFRNCAGMKAHCNAGIEQQFQ